jgi:hypothetical protein
MGGSVPKENMVFSTLLWASAVLQGIGAALLAGGTIVTIITIIKKVDGFNWIVFLLGGAVLSANLGLVCLLLGYRKRSRRDLSVNIQLPACAESGFRRSVPTVPAADRTVQSETASTLFSNFPNRPRTQLKIVR